MMAAFAEHKTANDKCAAAAEACTAAANKFVSAANTFMAAFADLEIAIVRFKTAVKCVEDESTAPAFHTKALCDITIASYKATIKAHKIIVDVSNATEEAANTYYAKHDTMRVEVAAFDSRSRVVADKLAIFKSKLKEASRVLSGRDIKAFRAEAATAMYQSAGKAQLAVAEQFVGSEYISLYLAPHGEQTPLNAWASSPSC